MSGFTVILPTLVEELGIGQASATWPASAFSLSLAAFLLIFGRLGDMYGGYPVYIAGLAWLTVWSLVAGFSYNELMLNFCRALQGLGGFSSPYCEDPLLTIQGPAAFLPASVMVLGSVYRPGPRKNLVFSIYGACAPLGFFIGIFFAGVTAQYTRWGWFFWVGTILAAITTVVAYYTVPSDVQEKRDAKTRPTMDWLGAVLIVAGLLLVTFAIVDSAHAPRKWNNPYIYTLFIVGCLLLIAAAYVEVRVATEPLLPSSLFKIKCMPALTFALFLTYGSLGILMLYATFYMQNIMGATPLQVVAWYTPMALGGCIIATVGGFFLHLIPGTILIIIAGISWIISPLLFAIAPRGANYWSYIFPSMICATIGIDVTWNVANIFITTSLPRAQQGLAGAVIMLLLHLGIAVCLGFADIVHSYTLEDLGLQGSYRAVFWLEVACAGAALLVLVLFVKIRKAESELTVDERAELERDLAGGGGGGGGREREVEQGRQEQK